MRVVGKRKERPIIYHASAALLVEGARFNDEMHKMPTGDSTYQAKGIFRHATHEEAEQQRISCLVKLMATHAMVDR